MPERDGYIPGVPCWVDTSQPDPEAAVDFYRGLFGWELENVMPPGSRGQVLHRPAPRRRRRRGRIDPRAAPPAATWNTYVAVESADETASKVRDAGGSVMMEPFDVMDAGRTAVFTDPEGAAFCVWQAKEHKGARVVNEPGSLNFNGLNTRDLEGAQILLRHVFGWKTIERTAAPRCGRCPATATTSSATIPTSASGWPRSAARRDSRTSSRASSRSPDDQPDVPAHWRVTFAVDDADAIAEHGHRARRQGGRPAVRCPVGSDDRHRRPAGRDLHGEQVRAREQGPRQPVERRGRGRLREGADKRPPRPTG